MVVNITGTVLLTGAVEWVAGTTIGGSPIVTEDEKWQGLAPVPVPPPNTGDVCPCVPPVPDTVENVVTPGTNTVGGQKMVVMGGMYIQKSSGKTCQPIMALSGQTVFNGTPVVTENDLMMFVGFLNGAGALP